MGWINVIDGWTDRQMDGQTDGRMDGQTEEWKYRWMDERLYMYIVHVWIDGWMDRYRVENSSCSMCLTNAILVGFTQIWNCYLILIYHTCVYIIAIEVTTLWLYYKFQNFMLQVALTPPCNMKF